MKKALIILVAIIVMFIVGLVAVGPLLYQYFYPQQATVEAVDFEVYLDDTLISNNTLIDWENVRAGEEYYYENLTVRNNGTIDITVFLIVEGLPADWTETWNANATTLAPNELAQGPLNLTVSVSAAQGVYNWDSWIIAEET